jgi:nitroimidazol reductase NimA-like FMN-containing flavoprotein (pyridoxamine 5'-phosphate oxidase superfamily)
MDPVRIPKTPKEEYDALIRRQYVARIAFGACEQPYVAPFVYVFDGRHIYFLSTNYGRKMEYFRRDPRVSVEIEEYAPDLSSFAFVALQGALEEVRDPVARRAARERFVDLIRDRGLSSRVLSALGHDPADPPGSLVEEEGRSVVWRLVGVRDIVALQNG